MECSSPAEAKQHIGWQPVGRSTDKRAWLPGWEGDSAAGGPTRTTGTAISVVHGQRRLPAPSPDACRPASRLSSVPRRSLIFAEPYGESITYQLLCRTHDFLFLAMSRSGSQTIPYADLRATLLTASFRASAESFEDVRVSVRLSVPTRHSWPAERTPVPRSVASVPLRFWFRLSTFVNARTISAARER